MNKIAIIGTVGIPARYGGFETLTEYLTRFLCNKASITVYCSSKSYTNRVKIYKQASLVYIPLSANGIQSIPYDIISLFLAARRNNTILILGFSGCIVLPIFRLFYPRKRLIVNIDGLEHQRAKWKKPIRKFLKYSEKLAVKYANEIIADNAEIQKYIKREYNKKSKLIAYGGDHAKKITLSLKVKKEYLLPDKYAFKVCRIEPENNIQVILEAFSKISSPLIFIGNWENSDYGKQLRAKYNNYSHLQLLDPIYDQIILNQIRSNSFLYVHGHSAGGTNPSLVEAMHIGLPVIAYDVAYNRETTFEQALYFKNSKELTSLILDYDEKNLINIGNKMKKIAKEKYIWEKITNQYYDLF